MEFDGKPDPEAETPLVEELSAGTNESNTTDSSDNTIEPADEPVDEATSSDNSIADPLTPTCDINDVDGRGQFTPESEKLEEQLRKLCDPELDDRAKTWHGKLVEGCKNAMHYRCLVGAAFWERRRRNNEAHVKRERTMNLQDWCDLAGINRKSGQRWADNWQAVNDAPQIIIDGAIREDIDLFRPMVAEVLKVILKELDGRIPDEDEVPALLKRLDPPAKPKSDKSGGPKGRKGDLALTPDPKKYCKLPATVEDLNKECPNFLASFADTRSIPAADVFKPLILNYVMKYPKAERHDVYVSISKVAADLAALELPPIIERKLIVEYDEGTEVVTETVDGPILNAFPTTEAATL